MTLADAIRKGAEQLAACRGQMFVMVGSETISACALGAALWGLLGPTATRREERVALTNHFPALDATVESPCVCPSVRYEYGLRVQDGSKIRGSIGAVIIHLNDIDRWSRERIADWLDTLPEDAAACPTPS